MFPCILGCVWLNNESAAIWILFFPMIQFIIACNMLMHYHVLLFSFLSFPKHLFWLCVCVCVFSLVSWLWHLKSLSLLRIQSHVVVLLLPSLLLLLLEKGSVIQIPKRVLRKTFLTGLFIRNAKLFCLIFQTHLYPVHLALGVRNLYARNPLDVLAYLYRKSTPTNTLSISLFLSLLWYSEEHVL